MDSRVISIVTTTFVFAAVFGVYLLTLAPTVMWYDMGEFATASATLGIAHNTGYPLLILTGKAFTVLPFGETAYRVNLVSALFTALAVGVTFGIIRDITRDVTGAAVGALTLAFASTVWANATWATSYGMNLFFTAVVMRCMFDWWRTREIRPLVLAALALGLGLCNHRLIALTGPPSLMLLTLGWRSLTPKAVAWSAAAFLAGLSLYLYVPIRGEMEPALSWAQPAEWQTYWSMLVNGQTPSAYWSFDLVDRVDILWQYPSFDLTWAGLALAAAGLVVCALRTRAITAYLALVIALDALIVQAYAIHNIYNYLTPAYLALCVLIGIASSWVVERVVSAAESGGRVRPHVAVAGSAAVLALLPAHLLVMNFDRVDRSSNYMAHDFARTTLDHMPPSATIMTDSWTAPPLWYVQLVEGYRRDVSVSPVYSAPSEDVEGFAREQIDSGRPLYVAEGLRVDVSELRDGFTVQPVLLDSIERMVTDALPKPEYRDDLVVTGSLYRVLEAKPTSADVSVPPGHGRSVTYPHGVTLAGVKLDGADVARGDVVRIEYYWRAERKLDIDLSAATVFVDDSGKVAETLGFPLWSQSRTIGEGVAPTSEWAVGELHREAYFCLVPRSVAPGRYDVRVASFDPDSPRAVEDAGKLVSVGTIVVR